MLSSLLTLIPFVVDTKDMPGRCSLSPNLLLGRIVSAPNVFIGDPLSFQLCNICHCQFSDDDNIAVFANSVCITSSLGFDGMYLKSLGSQPNIPFGHVPNPPPFSSVLFHSINPSSSSPPSNSNILKSAFPNFFPQIPTLKNPSCPKTAMTFSGLAFNHLLATLPRSINDS